MDLRLALITIYGSSDTVTILDLPLKSPKNFPFTLLEPRFHAVRRLVFWGERLHGEVLKINTIWRERHHG
jgi:hypothetical protein